jgi:hypothetical protein
MRLALTFALLLAAPATASAAPFGELPFRPVRGAAECLAPAGEAGALVRWAPGGAELMRATATGLAPESVARLGDVNDCPVAALDPSGAGVVAGAGDNGVRISTRQPGGSWSPPLEIAGRRARSVAVGISPRGDGVVAGGEYAPSYKSADVRIVQRVPGGAFGAPVQLAQTFRVPDVQTALTADGAALLVISDERAVRLATAAPGAPFGVPRTLARGVGFGSGTKLAVTPDGRALLAAETGNGVALFDREPGQDFVQRPTLPLAGGRVAVALAPDGTAVVASGSGESVSAVMRDGLGPFSAPAQFNVPPRPRRGDSGDFQELGGSQTENVLRVAIGGDRRALLTWPVDKQGLRAATLTSAGAGEVAALASPLRPALGATPVVLADGTRAVAWADDNDGASAPPYAGRVHYAVEGVADTPAAPVPSVAVGAPADRSLRPAQDLVLPVRCSAACDLRATTAMGLVDVSAALERAGTVRLRFSAFTGALAPAHGTLTVRLESSAPGARTTQNRTVQVQLQRLPAPPFPRIVNARVKRGPGGVVDVRWSTDLRARDVYFIVYGSHNRSYRSDPDLKVRAAFGRGRRTFHVRLRDAARVRYVRLGVQQIAGRRGRSVTLSVRSPA